MLKNKFLLSLLGSAMIVSTIPGSVTAEEKGIYPSNVVQQTDSLQNYSTTFTSKGVNYQMNVQENLDELIITFKSEKGVEVFTSQKNEQKIQVTSDYLSKNAIKNVEESVNDLSNQLKEQNVATQEVASPILERSTFANIQPMAQKGSWAWSNYQNFTINANNKVTVTAIASAIAASIPYVGAVAAPMATIMIQYNMKTGYFKRKIASKLDTDPNYYWQKIRLELYKDSARKKLIKTKYTKATKSLIMN